jgi:hypothetical protein
MMLLLTALASVSVLSRMSLDRRWHPETVTCERRAGENETTPRHFVIRIDDRGKDGSLELDDETVAAVERAPGRRGEGRR